MRTERTRRLSPALTRLTSHLVLMCLSIPFLLPLFWMVSTSLKTDAQAFASGLDGSSVAKLLLSLIPDPVRVKNYPEALVIVPFWLYLKNTLFLVLTTVPGAVLSSSLIAYAFGRLKFPGRDIFFYIMISTMALPAQVTMIPVFMLFGSLGWYNTFLPLIVPSLLGNAFYVFLLRQFFQTLPEELSEAARIDGATEWRIYWQMILPLAKPALAVCALFQFLFVWNDFFGPLLYINDPSRYTLAYGLQQFLGQNDGKWTYLMAGASFFTIPVIVLFFLAQKTFIQGIATTGVKN